MITVSIQESYDDFKTSLKDLKADRNIDQAMKGIDFLKQLEKLKQTNIYVGIPEEKAGRRNKKNEMNNATLMAIHTNGSPLRGLPERPIIEAAIEETSNAQKISNGLKDIGEAIVDEDIVKAKRLMKRLGQEASNMARAWFTDPRNNWPRVKEETAMRQIKKATKKTVTKQERQEMVEEYMMGVSGIKTTLIDTGQMRKAITYVIEEP